MAQGRCAGCGKTDGSCKKMKRHITECPDYLAVWKLDPAKALEPEEEFERWQREENSQEARQDAKTIRLETRFALLDAKRSVQDVRWAQPPDPLAEDDDDD